MDWDMPYLKKMTIKLKVFDKDKHLYTAISWPGYIGMATAISSQKYTIALNFRPGNESLLNGYSNAKSMQWPSTYLIRYCLDNQFDYETTLEYLKKSNLISKCYFTLSTKNINHIIGRSPEEVVFHKESKLTLVQTNNDSQGEIDVLYSNKRRKLCVTYMDSFMNDNFTKKEYLKNMLVYPLLNEETIYACTMNPEELDIECYVP